MNASRRRPLVSVSKGAFSAFVLLSSLGASLALCGAVGHLVFHGRGETLPEALLDFAPALALAAVAGGGVGLRRLRWVAHPGDPVPPPAGSGALSVSGAEAMRSADVVPVAGLGSPQHPVLPLGPTMSGLALHGLMAAALLALGVTLDAGAWLAGGYSAFALFLWVGLVRKEDS